MKTFLKFTILTIVLLIVLDSTSVADIDFKGFWSKIEGIVNTDGNGPMYGHASYYAEKYHGRLAANGEVFDMNKLTAAHRTLPFGTILKVTNMLNQREVVVRITDRGPFKEGRIIDLSKAAAIELDMMNEGIAEVKLEILN